MTDREAFEQELRKTYPFAKNFVGADGKYIGHMELLWKFWQTALAYARPEGYRLVPVAPTVEMINAGMRPGIGFYETGEITEEMAEGCYRAMIAAAPPGKEGEGNPERDICYTGATLLDAAMRCFVASKFGDTVEE